MKFCENAGTVIKLNYWNDQDIQRKIQLLNNTIYVLTLNYIELLNLNKKHERNRVEELICCPCKAYTFLHIQ
jgi:hypothetical protein